MTAFLPIGLWMVSGLAPAGWFHAYELTTDGEAWVRVRDRNPVLRFFVLLFIFMVGGLFSVFLFRRKDARAYGRDLSPRPLSDDDLELLDRGVDLGVVRSR